MADEPKLDLIVQFRLMPDGAEVDIEALARAAVAKANEVQPAAKVQDVAYKPIAFGLKSIEITFLMSDGAGGPDPLEEAFIALDGVGSAQVAQMGRI